MTTVNGKTTSSEAKMNHNSKILLTLIFSALYHFSIILKLQCHHITIFDTQLLPLNYDKISPGFCSSQPLTKYFNKNTHSSFGFGVCPKLFSNSSRIRGSLLLATDINLSKRNLCCLFSSSFCFSFISYSCVIIIHN